VLPVPDSHSLEESLVASRGLVDRVGILVLSFGLSAGLA
jgi:hypothetical protein